jgi:hypothetical protein
MERLITHPLSKREEEFIKFYREVVIASINPNLTKNVRISEALNNILVIFYCFFLSLNTLKMVELMQNLQVKLNFKLAKNLK